LKVSVIVPTLNEELILEKTLTQIRQFSPHEMIVSDGGSIDDTNDIAKKFSHRVIIGSAGRAKQMNAGAILATGDLLLFLHADSRLEPEGYRKMIASMKNSKCIGGTFTLCIESNKWSINLITLLANIRSKYFGLAYGDQGFFVRREIFKSMNGFSPISICEDLDFYRRLKKKGSVTLLKEKSHTSSRRWVKEGILFTTARNILIAILFGIGFPPRKLTKWYQTIR
jgi:rSAM/selenodomain-associated transferase 2